MPPVPDELLSIYDEGDIRGAVSIIKAVRDNRRLAAKMLGIVGWIVPIILSQVVALVAFLPVTFTWGMIHRDSNASVGILLLPVFCVIGLVYAVYRTAEYQVQLDASAVPFDIRIFQRLGERFGLTDACKPFASGWLDDRIFPLLNTEIVGPPDRLLLHGNLQGWPLVVLQCHQWVHPYTVDIMDPSRILPDETTIPRRLMIVATLDEDPELIDQVLIPDFDPEAQYLERAIRLRRDFEEPVQRFSHLPGYKVFTSNYEGAREQLPKRVALMLLQQPRMVQILCGRVAVVAYEDNVQEQAFDARDNQLLETLAREIATAMEIVALIRRHE